MSSHVETVKDLYARFGRGDVPGILERLDPEVEWEHDWGVDPLPIYAPRRGRMAVGEFFQALAAFEFLRFEPFAFLADGDLVAAPIHIGLRHLASGREFRDLEMHLWTFGADGLVRRFRHISDTRQLAWTMGVA